MWVTWPLGNDAEQYQSCFLDDGTGENEKSLGEPFQSQKVEGASGAEGVSKLFPCSFAWGTAFNAGVTFYGLEKRGFTAREVGWI